MIPAQVLSQPAFWLCVVGIGAFLVLSLFSGLGGVYELSSVRRRTVGNGQHGTAHWASARERRKMYRTVAFNPKLWREDKDSRPTEAGILVGGKVRGNRTKAFIDTGDVHALMIGAAGTGKTAYWLYPNLEYACASGVSFITTDTKGDLARNYGYIATHYYGYRVKVIDLRNPIRSNGNNILHLVNKYEDSFKESGRIPDRAKSERYAKIIARTIILSGGESVNFGQNAFFYDAAEGILTSAILLVSRYGGKEERHIISVYKLIEELLEPSERKGMTRFEELMSYLGPDDKIRWFSAAALASEDQARASVMSTALSRLTTFLDSELESILCCREGLDIEELCEGKNAFFIIMPEEDNSRYFMVSLLIQQLYREILAFADTLGGRLKKRVIFFCDEFGTLPKIESAELMFSASRSRGVSFVPIIQSLAQLTRHYGKEGAEIIVDNTQLTLFGGFAPNSETAQKLSSSMGSETVQSGSVSRNEKNPGMSLSMMARPLMTSDELKQLPKGTFIVEKTGHPPVRFKLKLYTKWGITLEKKYCVPDNQTAPSYVSWENIRKELRDLVEMRHPNPSFDKREHHDGEDRIRR